MRKNLVRRARHLGALGLVVSAGYAVFACSSHGDDDLPTQLQKDTGVAWGVVVDPRSNAPRILTPATPIHGNAGSPEADARAFFSHYGGKLGTNGHDLRVTVDEPEFGGGHYVRFQHYLAGTNLRVFDVVSMAHFAADGGMYVAMPDFRPGLDAIGHDPKLSADDATRAAVAAAVAGCGADPSIQPSAAPELGVEGDEDLPYALAYRVKLPLLNDQCLAPQLDIDAMTGDVIRNHPGAAALADSAKGTRGYVMKDDTDIKSLDISVSPSIPGVTAPTYRLETESSPKVVTRSWTSSGATSGTEQGTVIEQAAMGNWDSTAPAGPGEAVDAHSAVTNALRYFSQVHSRQSADGKNGEIDVFVHDNLDTNGGLNAKRSTAVVPYLVFSQQTVDAVIVGDGDYWQPTPARNWMPFSTAFDLMAHEVAHGVTAHTSNLQYIAESGALNETFSDVMGISADQWLSPERYAGPTPKAIIGDRVAIDGKTFLRDMIAPENGLPPQPSTTAAVKPCTTAADYADDFCRVHYNSGIGNRAWSLMTFGGTHAVTHVKVGLPMGFEAARVLWFETFTRLPSNATIGQAAVSQINWAWYYDRAHFSTVVCAWAAVSAIWMDPSFGPPPGTAPGVPPLGSVFCAMGDDAGAPDASTTTASSSPCSGKSDSWVCDPKAPSSAFQCNSGALTNTVTCADQTLTCVPRSASDPTANVDDTGLLQCE